MADAATASIVLSAEDKTGPAYQSAIKNMQAFQAQMKQGAANVDKFAQGAQFSTQQVQGLVHAVRAFSDQVLAGQSPLRAFALEFGKLSGTFGGAGNALGALGRLLNPVTLVLTALAVAAAAVGKALYDGAKASKEFKDAVTLSGNFAGQTAGTFDATAKALAAKSPTITIGQAKEAEQALMQTGQVGPQVFDAATEAVARYSKATGEDAKTVAKDFASMSDDVLKWATEHNKNLNFVDAKQLQQIKRLQETRHEVEAQALVYDALNERLRQLDANLGPFDSLLSKGAKAWSAFWDAAKGGDVDTVEGRIQQAQRALEQAQQRRDATGGGEGGGGLTAEQKARIDAIAGRPVSTADQAETAGETLRLLKREQSAGEQTAVVNALAAAENKEADESRKRLDGILDESKARVTLSKALEQNRLDFERAAKRGVPYTDEQKAAIRETTLRKFSNPSSLQADLDGRIKLIKDKLAEEEDKLKFHNDYLSGLYQAGDISLRTFYDEQRKITEEGVKDRLAAIKAERDAVTAALAKSTDPVQTKKLTTQRKDLDEQAAKVRQRAAEDVILSNQREAASFKALQDQIASFQEQLMSASGDPLGAELTRTETTIRHLKVLQGQAKETPGSAQISDEQIATLQQQLTVRAQLNESQREFARLTAHASNAEELLLLQAKSSGKGLLETEDELHALREKALAQLGDFIDRERERVALSKDPADLQHLEELALKYQQLQATVDPRKLRLDTAADDIGSALASGFERASEAGAKLSNILRDIGAQIGKIITRELVTKPIGESISNFIKGTGSGGSGSNLLEFFTNAGRKKDIGEGINTAGLTGEQRAQVFDHATTPAGGTEAAPGITATGGAQATAIDQTTVALQGLAAAANAASGALGRAPGTVTPGAPGSAPTGAAVPLAGPAEAGAAAVPGTTLSFAGDTTGADYGNESRRAAAQASQDQATVTSANQLGASLADTGTTAQQLADVLAMARPAVQGLSQSSSIAANALALLPTLLRSLATTGGGSSGGGSGILGTILNAAVGYFTGGSGYDYSGGAIADNSLTGDMIRNRRAAGGPVEAGTLYEVNEVGPELLTIGGKQLLMMGKEGGHVTPHSGLAEALAPGFARLLDRLSAWHDAITQPVPALVPALAFAGAAQADAPRARADAAIVQAVRQAAEQERTQQRRVDGDPWRNAARYHDGGIVGHEVPAILMGGPKGMREEVLRANDPRHADNGGGATQTLHVYVTPPPNASRDSATQAGVLIGQGIQRALRRNGG